MKLLFIQTTSPHGSINAQEGLDAVLMGSAFSTCTLLFTGDGVLQLMKDQDTAGTGHRNFSKAFGALRDYGVNDVYCRQSSLQQYGISEPDLVIDITPIDDAGIRQLLVDHDRVLTF